MTAMKSNIYTRSGDAGTTSLATGQRIKKNSTRIEAYGTIDELSSNLGLCVAAKGCLEETQGQLKQIQNELFNIGSYLASAPAEGQKSACSSLQDCARLNELEGWIDALDEQTPKVNAFILPGGVPSAAALHVARTICRRAERAILTLAEEEYVDPAVTRYINRLSDYLYIAARFLNFMSGEQEITWKQ